MIFQKSESKTLHPWRGVRSFERHGLVLMVAGLVYIGIGISYATAVPTPNRVAALHYAVNVIDYNHWGYVFVAIGILSIVSSRWPPVSETWGYQALTGQAVAWAGFYGAGVFFYDTPNSNLSAALTWGLIGFMWWAISGLVNPKTTRCLLFELDVLRKENAELRKALVDLKTEGE